ncbi:UDP-galactopyranose mutase [Methylacidiphilales bacterium]|nr:UDP-galactopyranose mutase [Candidatus Methylacidiphilales bacterium]
MTCDYLIVGAGFSGLVMAEQLSSAGAKCVVVDRRSHVGGNCYDTQDSHGVIYHFYGPHYFRTNSQIVIQYLSRFTEWREVTYRVRAMARGKLWSFPINLATYEELIGQASTEEQFQRYLKKPEQAPKNSKEAITSIVGAEFYELFFRDYTMKQWGRPAEQLDPSVCQRIPIRTNRDDRYFTDSFQALPAMGYTAMFEKIIANSPGLAVHLNMTFEEAKARFPHRHLIYTGPIDAYFDCRFGDLPFRTLRFELEEKGPQELDENGFAQAALQINYTGKEPFTRTVEVKHITGQQSRYSNMVREFPTDYIPGKSEPYYPIPDPEVEKQANLYRGAAAQEMNVTFLGRMATYRYLNMDQVAAFALQKADQLKREHRWQ